MPKKLSREEFIQRANLIHENRYDYSLVEYFGTKIKVKIICPHHGVFEQRPGTHLESAGCNHIECKNASMKQTCISKYGVPSGSKCPQVKKKSKQTNLERYGTGCVFQCEVIKDKIKQTNLERYGVKNPLQNNEIRQRYEQTNLERYGTKIPTKNKHIKDKIKQTNLGRYGTEYINQQHISPDSLIKLNNYDWLIDQHHNQRKTLTQIAIELCVGTPCVSSYIKFHNIDTRYYNQSYKCKLWLDRMCINIREYQIPNTKYIVDGYDPLTNIIYEFYGDYWHGNPNKFNGVSNPNTGVTYEDLYTKTLQREQILRNMGYSIISIWESEFNILINENYHV